MKQVEQWINRFDKAQRRHPVLGFPIAVLKKYGDDRGNDRVAVVAYYAFLSLFPLLLLLLTALEVFMSQYPEFRRAVLESTLSNFPVLSEELRQNIDALSGTWFRLVVSGILTLLASFGVVNALRNMINDFWQVPRLQRRGMPWNYLTNLALMLVGALIVIATAVIAGWLVQKGSPWYYGLSLGINFGLFLLAYRLATVRQVATKHLLIQAGLTALAWQILQGIGSYLVERQLGNLSVLYGSFAVVLGLLFWLYLVARIAAYAIEIDVVLTKKLWPRSISGSLTDADKRAATAQVKAERRHLEQDIQVVVRAKAKD